ncbi:MAG: membrane protein insertion efficiency factor YidD [Gemmatimonadota bacterium]|nr:membrane protein insertion efficiency factor YidD [Gemmatimonadota bacterium]
MSIIAQNFVTVGIAIIRMYQLCISPILPSHCRFRPTCSQYAIEALHKYGICAGLLRTVRRILRCHPFRPGGFDPA